MKTIEPLLYGTKPMNPEPINIALVGVAKRLRDGKPVMVKLEPGDGTHYGILIVPCWSDFVRGQLGRYGIREPDAERYLIVTKLSDRDGETCYASSDGVDEYDLPSIKHPWTKQIFVWWLNTLWAAIREV